MAAALHGGAGDLWTYWVAPLYRDRGVAVEEEKGDGEEGPDEMPDWVVRLTTHRDLRCGRARRGEHTKAKHRSEDLGVVRTPLVVMGNATSPGSGQRVDAKHGKSRKPAPAPVKKAGEDRKAAPEPVKKAGKPAPESAKKAYIGRNRFGALMSEIEAGIWDARQEIQEGQTFAEPQRQTRLPYIELAETQGRRATTVDPFFLKLEQREEWPSIVKFNETTDEDHEILLDATKPKPAHRFVGESENKRLERRMECYFPANEQEECPLLVKLVQPCVTRVQGPGSDTAAGGEAPSNPFVGATRRGYRRNRGGGRGQGDGGGRGQGSGGGGGGCGGGGGGGGDGGGGGYRHEGPGKTPVPRARCQDNLCNNLAKRYCSGCHFIYCHGCGCGCDPTVPNYVLQDPILVGDCEIHHPLSTPFPAHPLVLVRGVRSLMHNRVDYTFASVHEIFRVEDIEPDIPVLHCRLTDKGPFSWTRYPLVLVPGRLAWSELFH